MTGLIYSTAACGIAARLAGTGGKRLDNPADDLARLGLGTPARTDDDFWGDLSARFGAEADRVAEAVSAALGEADPAVRRRHVQAAYDAKNAGLELSLAVTAHFRGVLLSNVMRWFDTWSAAPPRRILDLGCDVGLLACCLAEHFPGARIDCVDTSRAAIRRASEYARARGRDQISFDAVPAREFLAASEPETYDLVVAVNAFEYIAGFPAPGANYQLAGATGGLTAPGSDELVGDIARVLCRETGTLVFVEEFANDRQQWWWLETVARAGLSVEWDRAVQLVAGRSTPGAAPPLVPLAVACRRSTLVPATRNDYLASAICRNLEGPGPGHSFDAQLAGVLFEAIEPKTLVRGVEIVHANGVPLGRIALAERHEVWEAGPLLLVYRLANDGIGRSLELRSKIAARRVFGEFDSRVRQLAGAPGVEARPYGPDG